MISSDLIAASPEEVSVDSGRLEELFARAKQDVDAGELPSVQVAIGRNGKIAGMRSFGMAVQDGVERPASDETLYCFYSVTKAIVASTIWALLEEDLSLDERVADIVPEFAGQGKEEITIEQVMLHTAGFPEAPMHPRLWEHRDARRERIKGWRLNWEPDSRYQYHTTSAHWVLAEIISRRTSFDFRDFVRLRIAEPMGIPELFVGLPDEYHRRAAEIVYTYEYEQPEVGWARPGEEGYREVTADTMLHFNLPSQRRAGCPAGGLFSGAGEVAMFYQVLVNGGETHSGARVLKPETIEMATTARTKDHHRDDNGLPVNRGLSVVVAGDSPEMRGFGRGASPRAFGHGGAGGQIGWGDPETGISIGYCTNGFAPAESIQRRGREISTLAAACAL